MNDIVSWMVVSFHSWPSIRETTRTPARTMDVSNDIASGMAARLKRSRLSTSRIDPLGMRPDSAALKNPASAPREALSPEYAETPRSDNAKLSSSR